MKHYLITILLLMAVFLICFAVVESIGFPVLEDPMSVMNSRGSMAAAFGVALLMSDVILPVPSSLVMVAHGAIFGVWIGTLLSLLGGVGAGLLGFGIGRRGGRILDGLVTADEKVRVNSLIQRWGLLAVIVTRPVPILGETVAIVAGTSSLGWGSMTFAAVAGSLPPAFIYALTGASVVDFASSTLVFGIVIVLALLIWLGGYYLRRRKFRVEAQQRL